MVAFLALLALVYTIPKFSHSLAHLFIKRDFIKSEIPSDYLKKTINQNIRSVFITAFWLIFITGIHIGGYWNYFKNEDQDLSNKGIYTPAIVTDKKMEARSKRLPGCYIYYFYKYDGLIYKHSCLNDTLQIGDTIVVKFSPNNPDHHIILNKRF
jgi:hypothetical protein